MNGDSAAFLVIVDQLAKRGGTTFPSTERLLGVRLKPDQGRSGPSMSRYIATESPANPKLGIDSVDLRVLKNQPANSEFLQIGLSRTTPLTASVVQAKYGEPKDVMAPMPGNTDYSMVLVYHVPGGRLRFAIGPDPEDQVKSVTVDKSE